MTRSSDSRPSPALIVAVVALVAAVGGTALGGQIATPSKISKKRVKKIANKQINKRLPLGAKDIADGSLGAAEFSSSIPVVRVTRTADQPIPFQSNNATTLAFDAEEYDTAAMHDNVINNSRLTAPVEGIYAVTVQITLSHSSPGSFRVLSVLKNGKNGVTAIARETETPPTTGTQSLEATTEVRLEAGDYIEATVFHDAGGLNLEQFDGVSPEFSITWLAPGP